MENKDFTPQEEPRIKKLTQFHYGMIIAMAALITTGSMYFGVNAKLDNSKMFMEGYNAGQYEQVIKTAYAIDVARERLHEADAELQLIALPQEDYTDEISEDRYLDEAELTEAYSEDQYNPYAKAYPDVPEGYIRNDQGYLIANVIF